MFIAFFKRLFAFFTPRAAENKQPMNSETQTPETESPTQQPPEPVWHVVDKTVIGASHLRAGLPNQDAINCWRHTEHPEFLPVVLSVADGHGGAKYFRSERGAKFAVDTATAYIKEFIESEYAPTGAVKFRESKMVEEEGRWKVPGKLLHDWAQEVRKDLRANNFTKMEMSRLTDKECDEFFNAESEYWKKFMNGQGEPQQPEDEAARRDWEKELQKCEAKLFRAYGATLLAVAVTKQYALYWQLGDGDILTVSSQGKVEPVMSKDERLFANETTSLCTPNARNEFRFQFKALPQDPSQQPALIMLSTDGYSNSYSSREGFEKVATDLLEMMSEDDGGVKQVSDNLERWLAETSQDGSGDDISVGIIIRESALAEVRERKRQEAERKREAEAEARRKEAEAAARADGAASTVAAQSSSASSTLDEMTSDGARPRIPRDSEPQVADSPASSPTQAVSEEER